MHIAQPDLNVYDASASVGENPTNKPEKGYSAFIRFNRYTSTSNRTELLSEF